MVFTGTDPNSDVEKEESRHSGVKKAECVIDILCTPCIDFSRRSLAGTVPDYSRLVLMACFTNPLIGAVVCVMHQKAKNRFNRGDKRFADALYYGVIVLGVVSIGLTVLAVGLVIGYIVLLTMASASGPANFRRCVLSRIDHERMTSLNITNKVAYCIRRSLHQLPGTACNKSAAALHNCSSLNLHKHYEEELKRRRNRPKRKPDDLLHLPHDPLFSQEQGQEKNPPVSGKSLPTSPQPDLSSGREPSLLSPAGIQHDQHGSLPSSSDPVLQNDGQKSFVSPSDIELGSSGGSVGSKSD